MATEPTLDQVRALLAQMEARQAEESKPTPTGELLADLADGRMDPRKLGAFVKRTELAFTRLGVDFHDESEGPAPAPADGQDDDPKTDAEVDTASTGTVKENKAPKGGKVEA